MSGISPESFADPEGGGGGGQGVRTPLEILQKYSFFCNTGPDSLKNHKATKPAFNVSHHRAHQQNAI